MWESKRKYMAFGDSTAHETCDSGFRSMLFFKYTTLVSIGHVNCADDQVP